MMNPKSNVMVKEETLVKLSKQATDYYGPFRVLGATLQRDIDRYGDYSEPGFEFTKEDVQLSRLYAGLTLVTKSIYDNHNRSHESELFMNIVNDVHSEDAIKYHSEAFPYHHPDFKFKSDLQQILFIIEKKQNGKTIRS